MIAERIDRNDATYGDFVKAYNYIEDNYGQLNKFRPVAQIITWYLLGAIDLESAAFANIKQAQVESGMPAVVGVPGAKAIVEEVVAGQIHLQRQIVNYYHIQILYSPPLV